MKIVKKNVYYCEFCKKKGLSASAIKKHEKGCTNNPKRQCGFCGMTMDYAKIANDLKKRYTILESDIDDRYEEFKAQTVKWIGEPITITDLYDLADGCPACVLTLLKLSGLSKYIFQEMLPFNFKEEKEKFWSQKNKEEFERDLQEQGYPL